MADVLQSHLWSVRSEVVMALYYCCEHCKDDPVYHEDGAKDDHTVCCSTQAGRPCPQGDTPVPGT